MISYPPSLASYVETLVTALLLTFTLTHDNRMLSKTDRNVSRDHGQWQHQCFPGCLRFGFTPLSLNHLSLSLPRNEENDLFDGRE